MNIEIKKMERRGLKSHSDSTHLFYGLHSVVLKEIPAQSFTYSLNFRLLKTSFTMHLRARKAFL